ncbi:hypothetical protein DI53_3632 [Sphingobacterium deserti]|uniref:Uncharacterized protein n=1 Tax=Sphingobacterium deserti TaxID=1229276 RepID=A0A0B8SYT4_9SPHI|nr:hypothetical protein DI53_3632 [Sphingobacterium deserti]
MLAQSHIRAAPVTFKTARFLPLQVIFNIFRFDFFQSQGLSL